MSKRYVLVDTVSPGRTYYGPFDSVSKAIEFGLRRGLEERWFLVKPLTPPKNKKRSQFHVPSSNRR